MKRTLSLLALAGITLSQFLWSQAPGDLDPSFSTDGWLIDGASLSTDLTAVAVMPDGRIVASGVYDYGQNHNVWVCRWWPDGSPDTGFDGDGIAVVPGYFVEGDEVGMDIQHDGKVVVATWLSDMNSDYNALIRLDISGALDSSFGQGGLVLEPTSSVASGFRGVHVQSSGRILVSSYGSGVLSVTAFDDSGTRDANYGPFNGQVVVPFSGLDDYSLIESAMMSSGEVTLLSEGTTNGVRAVYLTRLDVDGDLVPNFGSAGTATLTDTFYYGPAAIATADNGDVFVTGMPPTWTGNLPVAVRKYTTLGAPDLSWGSSGTAIIQGGGHMHAWSMMVASDGKVYVGGDYDSGPTDIMVARFTTGGQPDAAFGNNGIATDLTASGMIWANDMAEQPDGKVVVVGVQNNTSTVHGFAARFLTGTATAIAQVPIEGPRISIYPNPASERATLALTLDSEATISIEVRDLSGRLCLPPVSGLSLQAGSFDYQLPLGGLPSGAYQVSILANGQSHVQRFIVAH